MGDEAALAQPEEEPPGSNLDRPEWQRSLPGEPAEIARHGLLRGSAGALAMTVATLLALLMNPKGGTLGLGQSLAAAFQMGLPLGFWANVLTPLPEAWSVRGGARWSGAALAYLTGLAGGLLGVMQAAYAIKLGETESPHEALFATMHAAGNIPVYAAWAALTIPLGYVLVWAIRTRLDRDRSRARWATPLLVLVGVLAATHLAQGPVWQLALFAFGIGGALMLNAAICDAIYRALWGSPRTTDDGLGPLRRLTKLDQVVTGGRGFLLNSVLYALLALWVWRSTGGLKTVGLVAATWFLHMIVASSYASILLRFRKFERALDVARKQLADPWYRGQANERIHATHVVRALCGLERLDDAQAMLPRAMGDDSRPGLVAQPQRYAMALAFCAKDPTTSLQILDSVEPDAWSARLEVLQRVLRSVILDQLDRPAEALAALEGLEESRLARAKSIRGVIENNRAVYYLHLEPPDPTQALVHAQAAYDLLPKSPFVRGSYGSALFYALGDATQALPHLEASVHHWELLPPKGRAWAGLTLGRCYRALERDAEARASFERAAESAPNSRWGQEAREALEDTPSDP